MDDGIDFLSCLGEQDIRVFRIQGADVNCERQADQEKLAPDVSRKPPS